MAKALPTTYSDTLPSAYATGEPILVSDWQKILEAQHFHHARSLGFRAIGEAFDPPLTTMSAAYVRPAGLEQLQWATPLHRLTQDSANLRYRIWLVIIAEQVDVQLRMRDPAGVSTTLTASKSGTGFARVVATSTDFGSGASPKMVDLQIRQNSGGFATGSLAHVMIAEEPYTSASYLPNGR